MSSGKVTSQIDPAMTSIKTENLLHIHATSFALEFIPRSVNLHDNQWPGGAERGKERVKCDLEAGVAYIARSKIDDLGW